MRRKIYNRAKENTMLLAFDVGNTNIVLGVFKDGKMITNWRLETDNNKSADEYGMIIGALFKNDLNSRSVCSLHIAASFSQIFQ